MKPELRSAAVKSGLSVRTRVVLGSYPGSYPFSPVGWGFFIKNPDLKKK